VKRFVFDLEPALRLRERDETEAQKKLADALRREDAQKQKLQTIREEKDSMLAGIGDSQAAESAFRLLLLHWLHEWEKQWQLENQRLDAIVEGVRYAESQLLEKARDRKALESLKEKRLLEYRKERLRREQKEGDEVSARYRSRWVASMGLPVAQDDFSDSVL
jgi:flagellar FliJ protein